MIDLVLIDDDSLIHGTWKMMARTKGHNLECFKGLADFFEKKIPVTTPIYVDYHFNNGENGIELCKQLFTCGYQNLFIATGSIQSVPEKPDEIQAIVGKEYPLWLGRIDLGQVET